MSKRNAAKLAANTVLIENGLTHVTLDNLAFLLDQMGYEIIDYSKTRDDNSTWLLLEHYGLANLADLNVAFLYIHGNAKYIFLDESLPAEEKRYALAHELGHIQMKHITSGSFLHGTFQQEHEANEFAHYLLEPSFPIKGYVWTWHHKIIASIALICLVGGCVVYPIASVINSRSYHGGYYVTPHGTHYHVEDCFTIQGHEMRELSKDEFEENKYLPCSVCIHD